MTVPALSADRLDDLGNLLAVYGPDKLTGYMDRLAPDQREAVERAIAKKAAAGWRANPATMAAHLDPTYRRWPYVDLLAQRFADAFHGRDPHQIWNIPSQYGKTTGLMRGVVWALDYDPTLRLMYITFDADKAVEEGGSARDFAEAHSDRLRFRLRSDRRARGMWRTTEGGGLYCVGVNGGIVGWPADAILADDLIKGWQAAHSPAQRAAVMNIWRSQIRLRVQSSKDPIILAGTRWHQEDPSGELVKLMEADPDADNYTITRLPAIAEAPDPTNSDALLRSPDPLGRAPGEVLEPERFDAHEVNARRAVLGPYLWASMEQQRPAPEEGGELKRAWWRWHDAPPPRFDDAVTSWDTKLKDTTGGDFVVGQAWGRTGSDFWWLDQLRGQYNFVETKTAVVLMAVRHPHIDRHVIENTGNGPEVMQELRTPQPDYVVSEETRSKLGITTEEVAAVQAVFRRGMTGLLAENVKGSKTIRARAHSGKLEAGNLHLLLGRPEAEQLVTEAAAFPNGPHDDTVDAWSQAMKRLGSGVATVTGTRGQTVATPKPGTRARVGTARIGRPRARVSPPRSR